MDGDKKIISLVTAVTRLVTAILMYKANRK